MPSKDFLAKVQDIAVKTRIISRKQNNLDDLLDDSWLYEDQTETNDTNYYDNSTDRGYQNPKRETGRSVRSEKRTFGYQLPAQELTEDDIAEREVKRTSTTLHYRRNRAPRNKTYNVFFDVVK